MANHARFLVLPWVDVAHLASHLLAGIARRIQADWLAQYGHSVHCLETFVDGRRYRGVCYQAANRQRVGESTGRSRNDGEEHHRRLPQEA